jgi:thioredoxin-related protein
MSNLYKRVELVTNIAIIMVALTICVVLAKRYLLSPAAPAEVKSISAGEKISLPEMDWQKSRQTLLVVLSEGCHFCAESVPFYQRLAKVASERGDVRLVAVLPQPPGEGQKYIDGLGVPIKDVKQAALGSIHVKGTPTLILVDNAGVVINAWVGKLPSDQEAEVIGKLQCEACGS